MFNHLTSNMAAEGYRDKVMNAMLSSMCNKCLSVADLDLSMTPTQLTYTFCCRRSQVFDILAIIRKEHASPDFARGDEVP
jgi:hypothetical protein